MGKAGIFLEDDHVELIEGEIVEMTPIGSRHAGHVYRLQALFSQNLDPKEFFVRVQNPIRLSVDSEPEPDIAIVRSRADSYTLRHPGPEETLLIIEVADSSLDYDREIKASLYGRFGIPEVWVLNLQADSVHVFRTPSEKGYETQYELKSNDVLVPEKLPGPVLQVSEILVTEQV